VTLCLYREGSFPGLFPHSLLPSPREEQDIKLLSAECPSAPVFLVNFNYATWRGGKPMQGKQRSFNSLSRTISCVVTVVLATAILLITMEGLTESAQSQTFSVLHNFTGGQDGSIPLAGVTIDSGGNLYGTSGSNIAPACGAVFKLRQSTSGWVFNTLYTFKGPYQNDGCHPEAPVTIGPDGSLYGTTWVGGGTGCGGYGCGTVFTVKTPATACRGASCSWEETVIHSFTDSDGADLASPLIFDQSGNLYGTARSGGYSGGSCSTFGGCGTVFQLIPTSQGNWIEKTLHVFLGFDGGNPQAGVILGRDGNLYGATLLWGTRPVFNPAYGTVFQLIPSGDSWVENILHTFTGGSDGGGPGNSLVIDQAGDLYGGAGGFGGPVFQLSPTGGAWMFSVIYDRSDAALTGLTMDPEGNIFGSSSFGGGQNCGYVFKLTPSSGGWTPRILHDFSDSDGCHPLEPTLDRNGNLYGTTPEGGTGSACQYGCGTVWEITP
jgi:hypothetical protein